MSISQTVNQFVSQVYSGLTSNETRTQHSQNAKWVGAALLVAGVAAVIIGTAAGGGVGFLIGSLIAGLCFLSGYDSWMISDNIAKAGPAGKSDEELKKNLAPKEADDPSSHLTERLAQKKWQEFTSGTLATGFLGMNMLSFT